MALSLSLKNIIADLRRMESRLGNFNYLLREFSKCFTRFPISTNYYFLVCLVFKLKNIILF